MDGSTPRNGRSTTHPRGFTLIECLATVSIITMLTGMAMTGLNKARSAARGVVCQSSLRSLTTAVNLYYNEHNDLPTTTQHIINVPGEQLDIVIMLANYHDAPPPVADERVRPWVCPNDPVRYRTTGGTYLYFPAGLWVNYGLVPPRHNLRSLLHRNPRMRIFLDGMPIHGGGFFTSTVDGAVESGQGAIHFSI